jgi:hypothetical protein
MKRSILAPLVFVLLLVACQQQAAPRGGSSGPLTLAPSAARTTAFTGTAAGLGPAQTIIFQLDVTAVAGTSPTLDVKIQGSVDGTNFCDVAAFAQATATTRQLLRISTVPGTPQAQVACTDATLAAGTVHQGPIGQLIRVKHAIPGGTTPSFTYSVTAWVVAN